ncbi:MAG: HDIG domain-containing protein [Acidobacteria bacterium]|nr:HDIG domain-containing protein [Acidobacteriota bacterium]
MTQDQALDLLHEWTLKDGLRKHAYGVAAAMRAYARKFGEDEEKWAVVGLLHDFDYERYPDAENHPYRGAEVLRGKGLDEEMVRAVLSHASYTGVPRDTLMAKTLFAVDELVGFVTAVALVRPERKVAAVTPKSVRKKMKDHAFARSVNREEIVTGAEELGVELNEHIAFVVEAMAGIANELGL